MGIQLMEKMQAKKILQRTLSNKKRATSASASASSSSSSLTDVPKGHVVVYVGEAYNKKRQVIPISYLNHPLFQNVLDVVEEEFGFEHPMGGLTIPCSEAYFSSLIALIRCSSS